MKKIFLISIKKNLEESEVENLGAKFYGQIKNNDKDTEYYLNAESLIKNENFFSRSRARAGRSRSGTCGGAGC